MNNKFVKLGTICAYLLVWVVVGFLALVAIGSALAAFLVMLIVISLLLIAKFLFWVLRAPSGVQSNPLPVIPRRREIGDSVRAINGARAHPGQREARMPAQTPNGAAGTTNREFVNCGSTPLAVGFP